MNLWFMNLLNVGGPAMLATWVFWVIFSVVLHELAHGWTAVRCGDRTPIELGHLTWNPVVHMGTSGVLMMALLGVTWGRMPIDPTRRRRWYDEVLVTAAGPLTNLGLSVLCILVVVGYAAATKGQGARAGTAVSTAKARARAAAQASTSRALAPRHQAGGGPPCPPSADSAGTAPASPSEAMP